VFEGPNPAPKPAVGGYGDFGHSRRWRLPHLTGTVISEACGQLRQLTGSNYRKQRRSVEEEGRSRGKSYLRQALSRGMPISESLLLALHSRIVPGPTSGRYRNGPVRVRWRGEIVYVAPKAEDVPFLMKGFFDAVEANHSSDIVTHAGRALLRLLKIHPFPQGNGRTARGVATYMLLRAGYRERPLQTLEKYIDYHLEGYYEALALSSAEAPGPWDAYFSDAVKEVFDHLDRGRAGDLLALLRSMPKQALR